MAFLDSLNSLAASLKQGQQNVANLRAVTSTIGGSPSPAQAIPAQQPVQYIAGVPVSNTALYGLVAVAGLIVLLLFVRGK